MNAGLTVDRIAEAIADARLWPGAWLQMGEPEREVMRQGAEGVYKLLAAAPQAAAPPQSPACGAVKDSFTCTLVAGHSGDHKDEHPNGGCVGWLNPSDGSGAGLRQALEALADKMGERCGDHCSNSCWVCQLRNDLRLILVRSAHDAPSHALSPECDALNVPFVNWRQRALDKEVELAVLATEMAKLRAGKGLSVEQVEAAIPDQFHWAGIMGGLTTHLCGAERKVLGRLICDALSAQAGSGVAPAIIIVNGEPRDISRTASPPVSQNKQEGLSLEREKLLEHIPVIFQIDGIMRITLCCTGCDWKETETDDKPFSEVWRQHLLSLASSPSSPSSAKASSGDDECRANYHNKLRPSSEPAGKEPK